MDPTHVMREFERSVSQSGDKDALNLFKGQLHEGELADVVKYVFAANPMLVPSGAFSTDLPPCKLSPITFKDVHSIDGRINSFLSFSSVAYPGRLELLAEVSFNKVCGASPVKPQRIASTEFMVFRDIIAIISEEELSGEILRAKISEIKNDPNISEDLKNIFEKGKVCSLTKKEFKEIEDLSELTAAFLAVARDMIKKNEESKSKETDGVVLQKQKNTPSTKSIDVAECVYAVTVAALIGSVFKSARSDLQEQQKHIEEEREEQRRERKEEADLAEKNYMIIMKGVLTRLLKGGFLAEDERKRETGYAM
jgi:hypothetical protein